MAQLGKLSKAASWVSQRLTDTGVSMIRFALAAAVIIAVGSVQPAQAQAQNQNQGLLIKKPVPVPEPATMGLFAGGLVLLRRVRRRRRA